MCEKDNSVKMSLNLWSGMFSKELEHWNGKKLFSFFTIGLTITNLASIQKNSAFHY